MSHPFLTLTDLVRPSGSPQTSRPPSRGRWLKPLHRLGRPLAVMLLAWLFLIPLLFVSAPARAANLTVDGTTCTLADAITAANTDTATGGCPAGSGADTITLNVDVTLSAALPPITSNITLEGNGHFVSGNNVQRVFEIQSSGVATLTYLNIVSGTTPPSGAGGGILNNQGTLTVQNSTLSGNSAGYFGGGIFNNKGTVTVRNSTLSGNSAGNGGGGIFNEYGTVTVQNSTFSANVALGSSLGGGISNNYGTLTVQNSTFSGNSAYAGGGIRDWGTLVVTNSTFSGNSASLVGAGIAHDWSDGLLMSMSNTIIANSSSGRDCYSGTSITPNDHNLIEDGTNACGITNGEDGNITGLDPLLAPLGNYGGDTPTFALLPGSPAIDKGSNAACPSTDQRGMPRPQGGVCDIGAFEVAQDLYLPLIVKK